MRASSLGLLGILLLAAVVPSPAPAQSKPGLEKRKLVCWTDEHGHRACGDSVPPQYAKSERQVLNERGLVIETRPREKTPEERASEEREAQAIAAEKKRLQEQAAYDRYLLQAYGDIADMERARDERLVTLDGRIRMAEQAVADNEKTLAELRKRVDAAKARAAEKQAAAPDEDEPAPKAVNARLAQQVHDFENTLADNLRAVRSLKTERSNTEAKFAKDIERYRALRPQETKAAP